VERRVLRQRVVIQDLSKVICGAHPVVPAKASSTAAATGRAPCLLRARDSAVGLEARRRVEDFEEPRLCLDRNHQKLDTALALAPTRRRSADRLGDRSLDLGDALLHFSIVERSRFVVIVGTPSVWQASYAAPRVLTWHLAGTDGFFRQANPRRREARVSTATSSRHSGSRSVPPHDFHPEGRKSRRWIPPDQARRF